MINTFFFWLLVFLQVAPQVCVCSFIRVFHDQFRTLLVCRVHLLSAISFIMRQRYVRFCIFGQGLFLSFYTFCFVSFFALYFKFNVFLALRVFINAVLTDQCTFRLCCSRCCVFSFLQTYGIRCFGIPSLVQVSLFLLYARQPRFLCQGFARGFNTYVAKFIVPRGVLVFKDCF